MKAATDPRIDHSLPVWQQAVARRVRELVHKADAEVSETIKRTNRPYFELHGNICALLGTKDHLNIFIYDPIAPDPAGIINQGTGNSSARSVQVYEHDHLNEAALLELFKKVIANNRAGGWRRLQSRR